MEGQRRLPQGLRQSAVTHPLMWRCEGGQAGDVTGGLGFGPHSLDPVASLCCLPASRTHYHFGMRRASQKPLATWRGPLITNSWGLPFLSIPQPQAKWSPGQSTKWLFATKHLEMPEGSSWPVSPGSQSHSHTHSVKASVPAGMAQLGPASLSPHLQRVQRQNPWMLWKQAEGGEADNGRLARPGEEGEAGRRQRL